jgi:hypothetical protein
MIYYKKTTPNGTLYRGLNSATNTVIEVHEGALGNALIKIENEGLYTQLSNAVTGEGFVSATEEEFNSAKTTVLTVLNAI